MILCDDRGRLKLWSVRSDPQDTPGSLMNTEFDEIDKLTLVINKRE